MPSFFSSWHSSERSLSSTKKQVPPPWESPSSLINEFLAPLTYSPPPRSTSTSRIALKIIVYENDIIAYKCKQPKEKKLALVVSNVVYLNIQTLEKNFRIQLLTEAYRNTLRYRSSLKQENTELAWNNVKQSLNRSP